MKLLLRFAINAAAFWVTVALLPGLTVDGAAGEWLAVGLVFGLVNTLIGPVLRLLTLPLKLITLGLSALVVNGVLLVVTAWVADAFTIDGGFGTRLVRATGAAVVISLVSALISFVLRDSDD